MHQNAKVLILTAILAVTGCQAPKKMNRATVTPQENVPLMSRGSTIPAASLDSGAKKQLSTCLFEAEQLLRINREKYQQQISTLYQNIRDAKYYASVAGNMNSSSTDTLTPMYQFKVNDACNTVSQLLLTELKQGSIMVQGGK
ncbi:hypothetical protein [uncultured Enterobacter sp.]|uniref:hypothetical protein n=1 Tax=uncultured Enterobacter sp. TaxID=238202 RepID=UPI0025E50A89|nr:hypothetical protein [uncultured Enterobacter sp.]